MAINNILAKIESWNDEMVACRRDLHKHAEPGWREYRTTAKIIIAVDFTFPLHLYIIKARMAIYIGIPVYLWVMKGINISINELVHPFMASISSLSNSINPSNIV